MATGLDCDGAAKITGGTFIQIGARETVLTCTGCATLNYGSAQGGMGGGMGRPGSYIRGGTSSSYYVISAGEWSVDGTDISFTIANGYSYYGCCIYSSALTAGTSYTLSNGTTTYTTSAS